MKVLLWILGGFIALLVVLSIAVSLLFDANAFRGKISAQVEQNLHRQLTIGDLHLSLFPTLGVRIKNVTLSNAEGFGEEPMAQVGEAKVGVRILPLLFHKELNVSSLTLHDLHLNLLRHADGKSNWDDLVNNAKAREKEQPPEAPAPNPTPHPQPREGGGGRLNIGGVDIDNANINYVDQQAHKSYALSKFMLSTGSIRMGKAFDFKTAFTAALAQPAMTADVAASAKVNFDGPNNIADIQNLEASVTATGAGMPGGKQEVKLSGGAHFDGDKGTFKLSDGKLQLANLTVKTSIDGTGLDGGTAHFSGPLSIEPFSPRDTLKALGIQQQTADPKALEQASLSAKLDATKDSARLDDLLIKLDQSTLSGSAGVANFSSAAIQFALKLDAIDVDRYLEPARRNPVAATSSGKPGEGDNTPLPLDKLDGINANGFMTIGKLKAKNLNLNNVALKLAAAKGAQKTADLSASLYGGSLNSATRIGPGARPTLGETLKLANISAGPLLQDFMGKDYVSGQGNVGLDVTTAGKTLGEIKRGLNGSVNVALQNGAVKGFNLAQIIRQAQALSSGQALPPGGSGEQTDFTSMTVSGKIANGVLHSDDLNAASPLLRLTGAGTVDLVNNTLDYTAKPTVVNTATGQGGKQLAQLQGVVIPVRVYGPFNAPKYQLDVASALQQQAVQKLTQKLGGQKGGDVINQLQDLFKKKK
jgi:AsmA protein